MPSGRQAGAYPSLIPGNQECGAGQWDVIELDPDKDAMSGYEGPTTSKVDRVMKIPPAQRRHDWWIRYHELCHVERPNWEAGNNKLRNLMRTMLEEIALDGMAVNRDGIDLRAAREMYDYSKAPVPKDVYAAVGNIYQVWTSARVTSDAGLKGYYDKCKALIDAKEQEDSNMSGLWQVVEEGAEAVFADYSSGNCEDWADIVTAKLLGVKKEDLPNAPEPPSGPCTGGPGGAGAGSPGEGSAGEEADDESGSNGVPGAGDEDAEAGDDSSEDTCEACDGEGVDEDGDECSECGGTGEGEGGSADTQPGEGSDEQADGGQDSSDSGGEAAPNEWDTPPIQLDKARQNEPFKPSFDPLGRYESKVDPHALPPEKQPDVRKRITQEELQEEIDRERANRKAGEISQQAEITARTPHGAVDVHRHTLSRGVSTSVAQGWRSAEIGSIVRYPGQMFPSGRVFAKKAPGGSIILDGSGSMDWHTQHIVEAQKQMPNLYVAVYSHHGSNGYWYASKGLRSDNTFMARYCIVAQKGKLDPDGVVSRNDECDEEGRRLHSGANSGADPAALYYAATSGHAPKPIVWVSDGMVDFGERKGFWQQCDMLMRQHKIVRVLTIEDAIDYLLGKAVPGWHQCATVDTKWVRLGQPIRQTNRNPYETVSEASRWTQKRQNARKR